MVRVLFIGILKHVCTRRRLLIFVFDERLGYGVTESKFATKVNRAVFHLKKSVLAYLSAASNFSGTFCFLHRFFSTD